MIRGGSHERRFLGDALHDLFEVERLGARGDERFLELGADVVVDVGEVRSVFDAWE